MTTQGEMSYLTNKWEHGLRERASFDHEGKLFSMRQSRFENIFCSLKLPRKFDHD